jgi:hypothetical protein
MKPSISISICGELDEAMERLLGRLAASHEAAECISAPVNVSFENLNTVAKGLVPGTVIPAAEFLDEVAPAPVFADEAGPISEEVFNDLDAGDAGNTIPFPPAPLPPVGQQLDSRGFPWDARIHSSTRSLCKNGSWKYLRGVTDEAKAIVETQIGYPIVTEGLKALIASNPPPPPAAAMQQVPPPPATGPTKTFIDYIKFTRDKAIRPDMQMRVLEAHNIKSIAMLSTHPELIAMIIAELEAAL